MSPNRPSIRHKASSPKRRTRSKDPNANIVERKSSLETSYLYGSWEKSLGELNSDPGLLQAFRELREIVSEQAKFIVKVFPQYTPHDASRHLERLFHLADRVLGKDLYARLNAAELSLLVFALYSHDWGMAVSDEELEAIVGRSNTSDFVLIPNESEAFERAHQEAVRLGKLEPQIWEDYLRETHALRSGQRLRSALSRRSQSFAEMVARVAEGHVLDIREIRDPERYPLNTALLGQVTNVAAIATYLRLVDLLDIADDRTPFALWSMVRPQNPISKIEWKKHRALAPIATDESGEVRQVIVGGATDDPDVFAALADLRSWVDAQFAESVGFLRYVGGNHQLNLDSTLRWEIKTSGFEPVLLRFDFDRTSALGLLSSEVYGGDRLTFVRELMQNSVDAIDTRAELLRQSGASLEGAITVNIASRVDRIQIEWSDNGVGMDRYVLEGYFARIGRSWYQSRDFRRHSLGNDPISKFGIGLLSCFAISQGLTVLTKREPQLARDTHGWRVQVPSRDGHFSVQVDENLPVGTTLILETEGKEGLSAAQIASAIKRFALLVKYKIMLKVDALEEVIAPAVNRDESQLPFVRISSLDEKALASLHTSTTQLNHRYQSPDGSYEAFFSCLLPKSISAVKYLKAGSWGLGQNTIDFADLIVQSPPDVLLKGIAARGKQIGGFHASRTCLNILKPSLIKTDLSRNRLNASSINQDEFWGDVALRIREAIAPPTLSIQDRVELLSVASRIAKVPEKSLSQIVSPDQWPVWMLKADLGFSWKDSSTVLSEEEVLEAPNELLYVMDGKYHDLGLRHAQQWKGPSCFLPLGEYSEIWWAEATRLVKFLLRKFGFTMTKLRFVNSGKDDPVPLICPVWTKMTLNAYPEAGTNSAGLLQYWKRCPAPECPDILSRAFSSRTLTEFPLLVRFPAGMDQIAAIGSIYWNQDNLKVRNIVETLLRLSENVRHGTLSGPSHNEFAYLSSSDFLGYVVPSRHSSLRHAVERHRGLLVIAAREGLCSPVPLDVDDFLPGSVGKYWNPYHYPIQTWSTAEKPVGEPWAKSTAH